MNSITIKQIQAIKEIEKLMGFSFTGKTKQDAFLWLQENVPKAQKLFIANHTSLSELQHIASKTTIGLPEGIEAYPNEVTPTKENLDIRYAIDSLLFERF